MKHENVVSNELRRVNFLPYEDCEEDVSSLSSWSERIRILPCLQRLLAGSVTLKVFKSIVILLKVDALLRAKVIASNSEESLLVTSAEMRKNNNEQNRKMNNRECLTEAQNLIETTNLRDITPYTGDSRQTPSSLSSLKEKSKLRHFVSPINMM